MAWLGVHGGDGSLRRWNGHRLVCLIFRRMQPWKIGKMVSKRNYLR